MDDKEHQAAAQKLLANRDIAAKQTIWMTPRSLSDPKARFHGFRQRVVTYKAGTQIKTGACHLSVDVVMHESVATQLSDGTKLYSDIFLPGGFTSLETFTKAPVPAIVVWSPYGKQEGSIVLGDLPLRAGVPKEWLSGLEKFEGPDPAYWCEHNYAIINVDTRGAYTSEGDLLFFGHQEFQDGADFITWVSEQPWCNGKVALTGNSWLAITQWGIGSLRPKGLAALAPWEGFNDYYRHHIAPGGIPFPGFQNDIAGQFAGQSGKAEDAIKYLASQPLIDEYWEDKRAHPEWINVPTYVVASWTNQVHTPGTFKAWAELPEKLPKWLRVNNSHEWYDYYHADSQNDLRRFYDYYLHGKTQNGWETTPKVRLSILEMGLTSLDDTVNRAESSFPLTRTKYTRYYLQADKSLALQPQRSGTVSYDSTSATNSISFEHVMQAPAETTGYFMAHLLMSCPDHDEMDVFVQIEKLNPQKYRQGTLCIKPQATAVKLLLKFMHDWQIGVGKASLMYSWGPDGCLRASHALGKNESLSKIAQPYYDYKKRVPMGKGEVRALDIELRPYGMFWEKGDILRFTISGKKTVPFFIPVQMHVTDNNGAHVIHCGTNKEDSSYLLLPHVE